MKPDKQPPGNADDEREEQPSAEQSSVDPDSAGIDARDDSGKLKENRRRLGVDEDHRTPDMKDHHRGTFP